MTPEGAQTWAARPGDERTNHEATAAPTLDPLEAVITQVFQLSGPLSPTQLKNLSYY